MGELEGFVKGLEIEQVRVGEVHIEVNEDKILVITSLGKFSIIVFGVLQSKGVSGVAKKILV